MNHGKQLFVFDTPTKNLLTTISGYPVHFFVTTTNGTLLMANELQVELFDSNGINYIPGINISNFMPEAEHEEVASNNSFAINSNTPQLFYETGLGKECLCIKTRVNDSSNHCIGIGGVAFFFHQIILKDIITVINKLVFLSPVTNDLKYTYIDKAQRFNMITPREKECAYYLTKGMTYKEIGGALRIGHRTVETHIENIKKKLGCYNRSDIVSKLFEIK